MKVFILDDSEVLRERLKAMLSEISEVEIIGQAGKPVEAIRSIKKVKPDVAILDIRIPCVSSSDIIKYFKGDNPDLLVIMLTNYPYSQDRKKCMEKRADSSFSKSIEFNKIKE